MDRYGRTSERTESDPSPEWTDSRAETGLEEGVWQVGLGEGEVGYPERPEEADCIYYLRTGYCGYGSRCRFNHPRDRGAVLGAARGIAGDFPERIGQPVCQYYMRTGACKFGSSCKYHHPKQGGGGGGGGGGSGNGGGGAVNPVPVNYYGFPFRPGEKECTYYVKTGQCKFGATCKFHHPQPANLQILSQPPAPQVAPVPAPTLYPTVQSPSVPSTQQYGLVVARPPLVPGYVQGPYGPMLVSPGVVPYPSWSPYPAPVSPVASAGTQPGVGTSVYGMAQLSASAPAYTGAYQPMPTSVGPSSSSHKEQSSFPERPGQPECQYYMKTGDCKFGSSCRYHHPPELIAPKTHVLLSSMGLPLRPGAPICTHYTQRGQCKFGPACKFDHPMGSLSYSPSASSLSDMPVAPYPVGSSVGTLAPSSSSSELRPEQISGLSKDSSSTRMSSAMSTSSGSVGSIFSKSDTATQSGLQQSSQSSGPSTVSSSTSSSTDVHTSS